MLSAFSLNNILLELQNENKQLKNRMVEIKTNYVSHDEDFNNIKTILTELNNETDLNLKKIRENEKKFYLCSCGMGSGQNGNGEIDLKNNDNEINEDKNKTINEYIKEIDNNIGDYKIVIR